MECRRYGASGPQAEASIKLKAKQTLALSHSHVCHNACRKGESWQLLLWHFCHLQNILLLYNVKITGKVHDTGLSRCLYIWISNLVTRSSESQLSVLPYKHSDSVALTI